PLVSPAQRRAAALNLASGPSRWFPQPRTGLQRSPRWEEDPSPSNPHPPAGEWTEHTKIGVADMKKVFTTGQVAKICKVAPRTVSKWFDSGRLRGYRIPGSQDRRIPREHLIKFLKEHGMPLGELEEE